MLFHNLHVSASVHTKDIHKVQGKLIKCIVSIGSSYQTTPLLDALVLGKASTIIQYNSVKLLRCIMSSDSASRNFNLHLLSNGKMCKGTLLHRVFDICKSRGFNFLKVILDNEYFQVLKSDMLCKMKGGTNGLIDSLRMVLEDIKCGENQDLLKALLRAY